MFAEDARVRSWMAELAREVRYVKQRFKRDVADERPYLVRSLKIGADRLSCNQCEWSYDGW